MEAQRQPIQVAAEALSPEAVWARPEAERWSIGENLQHLKKMMGLFRRVSRVALVMERPLARVRHGRPFPIQARNVFSGRARRAPFPIRPRRPATAQTSTALMQDLERETHELMRLLRGEEEAVLGHVWLWDPVMGRQNLIQVVHLLALPEEHHFDILRRRWPEVFPALQ